MSLDITPAVSTGTQIIQAYGDGGFRIANEAHDGSVIVFKNETIIVSAIHVGDFNPETLMAVTNRSDEIDILVIGCGEGFSRPDDTLRTHLKSHSIVMEWMDTGAACRTFNVLMTEGRRAAAALIAVTNDTG